MNVLYPVYSGVQVRNGVRPGSVPGPSASMQMPAGLPMNVLTRIIAHVEEPSDILNITQTSRLLYYLALPKLYQSVTLRSYSEVRRKNGRIEGLGAGSPFTMALSALATSQGASAVKKLKVEGDWHESDDYMLGRIPDVTVLLSIALRAAIDRMVNLETFTWELDTKPLRNVYDGLSLRSTLRSFHLAFPSHRSPRPISIVPGIPSLVSLRVTNLDPLCYNDDISYCLRDSKNLQELKLQWSPRMRLAAECSANLNTVFGKCIEAGYKMSIRSLGMQNFYGPNRGQLYFAMKQESMVDTHFLDMFGGAHGPRTNVFIDETWRRIPPELNFKWKLHRSNELAMQHTRILRGFSGLEELYLVNKNLSTETPVSASPLSPATSSAASSTDPGVLPGADLANLGNEYLDAILKAHAPTLRNLLFFDKFDFSAAQLATILSSCPNLRQLGLAVDGDEHTFRALVPSLPSGLVALRLLENPLFRRLGVTHEENLPAVCAEFARQIAAADCVALRWIGLADRVFHVQREGGEVILVPATWEDVAHVGIWGMDNLRL